MCSHTTEENCSMFPQGQGFLYGNISLNSSNTSCLLPPQFGFGLVIIFPSNLQLLMCPSYLTWSYYPCKYHLFYIVILHKVSMSKIFTSPSTGRMLCGKGRRNVGPTLLLSVKQRRHWVPWEARCRWYFLHWPCYIRKNVQDRIQSQPLNWELPKSQDPVSPICFMLYSMSGMSQWEVKYMWWWWILIEIKQNTEKPRLLIHLEVLSPMEKANGLFMFSFQKSGTHDDDDDDGIRVQEWTGPPSNAHQNWTFIYS